MCSIRSKKFLVQCLQFCVVAIVGLGESIQSSLEGWIKSQLFIWVDLDTILSTLCGTFKRNSVHCGLLLLELLHILGPRERSCRAEFNPKAIEAKV